MFYRCWGWLLVFFLAVSCRSIPETLPELTPPDWQDGETAIYNVLRNGEVLFRRVITLEYDEEAGEPILVFTNTVQSESAAFYFFDSTTFALTRFTLKPLWLTRTVATEISISEAEAEFEDQRVVLRKQTVDGESELIFKARRNTLAIEMLPMFCRSVPLEPALSFVVQAVIPLEMRELPIQIKVLGTKSISTPLGEILCREVEAVAPGRNLRFAYELAEPHRLVAIRDFANATETVLADFFVNPPSFTLPEE